MSSLAHHPPSDAGPNWLGDLRAIFTESLSYDWATHLQALNNRLGLTGPEALELSMDGLPPVWFNGDVEAIEPGQWTLVISLNHQRGHYARIPQPASAWDFWRLHNSEYWYPTFFRPLVHLATTALGGDIPPEQEPSYATSRMVFVEICPYASKRFGLSLETVRALANSDIGFRMAARFNGILLTRAQPALVLVNGSSAVDDFAGLYPHEVAWGERRYDSNSNPPAAARPKRLRHSEGWFATPAGRVPIVGFPFLKKASTHNSNAEIAQLGNLVRVFLGRAPIAAPPQPQPATTTARSGRDYTRFDVSVGDRLETRLPKRRAMLAVVKALIAAGVSPDEIQHALGNDPRLFRSTGDRFSTVRYFDADADLIHYDGQTYALWNQWGIGTFEAIQDLLIAFPDTEVRCRPATA